MNELELKIKVGNNPTIKSIFNTWEQRVHSGLDSRIGYGDYQKMKDFFCDAKCPDCGRIHSEFIGRIGQSGGMSIICPSCGTFRIIGKYLRQRLNQYCMNSMVADKTSARLNIIDECIDKKAEKDYEEIKNIIEENGIIERGTKNMETTRVSNSTRGMERANNNNNGGVNDMMNRMFKGLQVGFVEGDNFKLSPMGIAFKNQDNGYVVYNSTSQEMTDVTGMTFDMANMIMAMPVAIKKIKVDDIVVHNGAPVVVKEVKEKTIVVVFPFQSEVKEIMPIKNMFGFNFYTKLTPLMDLSKTSADEENPFGNLMPMMMMSQLAGNNNGQGMNPMMMAMMMGGLGKEDGENDGLFSKDMMMMMAMSGNGTGGNDMNSMMSMMMMSKMLK